MVIVSLFFETYFAVEIAKHSNGSIGKRYGPQKKRSQPARTNVQDYSNLLGKTKYNSSGILTG